MERLINSNSQAVEPLRSTCLCVESLPFKTHFPSHPHLYRGREQPPERAPILLFTDRLGCPVVQGLLMLSMTFLASCLTRMFWISRHSVLRNPVWRLEGGSELNAKLVVNLFSKMLQISCFCPSQALAEGQDSEGVHSFCFSPPILYCSPNHY